jgi:hypothetical protein
MSHKTINQMRENILIFWKDVYQKGYRKGVTHGWKVGSKYPLCGIKSGPWDGGYNYVSPNNKIECKNCLRKLKLFSHARSKQTSS